MAVVKKVDSLSVVIPMYNEEYYAREVVAEAIRAVSSVTSRVEVIAVDDHSSDATPVILENLVSGDSRIKTVRNSRRLGLGGALLAGFAAASGSAVLYTDADFPCDMGNIRRAVELMEREDADIVSAYRSGFLRENFHRSAYSFVFNGMVNLFFNPGIKDVNFSFKLFDRGKLNALRIGSRGSFINTEMFVKAKRSGYKIAQFPAQYLRRAKGVSKLDNFGNIFGILREMACFAVSERETPSVR